MMHDMKFSNLNFWKDISPSLKDWLTRSVILIPLFLLGTFYYGWKPMVVLVSFLGCLALWSQTISILIFLIIPVQEKYKLTRYGWISILVTSLSHALFFAFVLISNTRLFKLYIYLATVIMTIMLIIRVYNYLRHKRA